MSARNDGGPAFPEKRRVRRAGYDTNEFEPVGGMTLRDYFAAKAMQGLLSGNTIWSDLDYRVKQGFSIMENNAFCAYAMADAMLAARDAA